MARTRQKRKPVKKTPEHPAPSSARWVIPALLLLLLLVIVYVLLSALGVAGGLHYPVQEPGSECADGQSQPCSVGQCSGTSVCTGGAWGNCRWSIACSPGSRIPCLSNGCNYAYKECNACGSGYGPCVPVETPPSSE